MTAAVRSAGKTMRHVKADLHIHTCLSPCAEIDMSPRAVVRCAMAAGLDMIAVTDHNSAENSAAAVRASDRTSLTVLSGMEVTSAEEAHVIALFDNPESALSLQKNVYGCLTPGANDAGRFGEQVVADENDEVTGFNTRLLIGATSLHANEIVSIIHYLGGIAVASHIDRDAFSILSQAGFISPEMGFDALEISPASGLCEAEVTYADYRSWPWITSSDAHRIEDIGRKTTEFLIREPTISEISLALSGADGRSFKWL